MKISRLILLFISITLFSSCRSQLTVRNASWYTWAGGQPGVGGVKYQIVLNNEKEKSFKIDKLFVDGNEIKDIDFEVAADSITITASEKEKMTQPTLQEPNPQRKLKGTDPKKATLRGLLDGKQVKVEIDSFTKEKSISYQ